MTLAIIILSLVFLGAIAWAIWAFHDLYKADRDYEKRIKEKQP